jgi:hypothetical protein
MPLVLVFFSSKRFGICKRPIWGVNSKGWEIRVRFWGCGVDIAMGI